MKIFLTRLIYLKILNTLLPSTQHVEPLLTLASSDHCPNLRHNHIKRCTRLPIIVATSIERLQLLRVVVHDHRLLVDLLCQDGFVLLGERRPPLDNPLVLRLICKAIKMWDIMKNMEHHVMIFTCFKTLTASVYVIFSKGPSAIS